MLVGTFFKNKKGFTLIELLVVISIIGLLSSIVLASLNTSRVKAADTAIREDLRGIKSSAEIEYSTLGYKYNTTGIAVSSPTCSTLVTGTTGTILQNNNIKNALKHIVANNGGKEVTCNISADGTSYNISAPLRTTNISAFVDSASSNLTSGVIVPPQNFGAVQYNTNGVTFTYIDNLNPPNVTATYYIERSTGNSSSFVPFTYYTVTRGGPSTTYGTVSATYTNSSLFLLGTTYYWRARTNIGNQYSPYTSNQVYFTMQ